MVRVPLISTALLLSSWSTTTTTTTTTIHAFAPSIIHARHSVTNKRRRRATANGRWNGGVTAIQRGPLLNMVSGSYAADDPSMSTATASSATTATDSYYGSATPPESATTTSLASTMEATLGEYSPYSSSSSLIGYVDQQQQQEEEETKMEFDLSESIVGNLNDGAMNWDQPSLNFARVLVLTASAVYGTNFAIVKLLDEQIPFAISAAMRFTLAASVVTAMVLQGEYNNKEKSVVAQSEKERGWATWAGMEIGGWYCLGYLCQAVGLQTADASKVRKD